jgi:hypothetical protein
LSANHLLGDTIGFCFERIIDGPNRQLALQR